MSKIGRNQICPCGSGYKYKHCCGAVSEVMRRSPTRTTIDELSPEARQRLIELQREMDEDRKAYGHAQPMVTVEHQGYRIVAVRNQLQFSKNWKTPIDFLGDYIKTVMDGAGWGNGEIAKRYEERHPTLQWYQDVCTWQREHEQEKDADGVFSGVATGSVKAYYALAYDLWTLDNHAVLQNKLIHRLKNADQFQGARYELYVIASMIRAGFHVELQDESDSNRTHCELAATHRRTGRKFSVEAKSTGRPGMLGKGDERTGIDDIRADIYRKLQNALLKEADYDRVVFIDVNMPPHKGQTFEATWVSAVPDQLKKLEDSQSADNPYPSAFLFFTNHPYHYVGNDDVEPSQRAIFTGINRDDLKRGPEDGDSSAAAALAGHFKARNPEIDQLVDSVFNHTKVPTRF
jgi:hypothetical protein